MFSNKKNSDKNQNQSSSSVKLLSEYSLQEGDEKDPDINYAAINNLNLANQISGLSSEDEDEGATNGFTLFSQTGVVSRDQVIQSSLDNLSGLVSAITESDERVSSEIFNYYNNNVDLERIERNSVLENILNSSTFNIDNEIEAFNNDIVLLSHESYKITKPLFTSNSIFSNGLFIKPDDFYKMKSLYLENKLQNLANTYFINSQDSLEYQKDLIDEIKIKNKDAKNHLNKIKLITYKDSVKKKNFIDQAIKYAKNNEYNNYFGKVFKKIHSEKLKDYATRNSTNINDESFLNINNTKNNTQEILGIENTFKNYLKLQINNNVISDDLNKVLDSDVFISSVLQKAASSLRNLSEGSFLKHNYEKSTDENFTEYNMFQNSSLNKIPILTTVYDYADGSTLFNEVKKNNETININSSSYSNTKSLSEIFSYTDNKFNYSYTKKIDLDHYLKTNFVLNKTLLNTIIFSENDLNNKNLSELCEYYLNLDVDGRSLLDFKNKYNFENQVNNENMFENFEFDLVNIYNQKHNILEVDAIIFAREDIETTVANSDELILNQSEVEYVDVYKRELTLNYFDVEGITRLSDNSSEASDYLRCPTFSLINIRGSGENVGDWIQIDGTFRNAFGNDNNIYGNFENRTKKYINSCRTKNSVGNREPYVSQIPFNFLDLKFKSFQEIDKNRIMLAASTFTGSDESQDTSASEASTLGFFIDRCWYQSLAGVNGISYDNINYGAVAYRKSVRNAGVPNRVLPRNTALSKKDIISIQTQRTSNNSSNIRKSEEAYPFVFLKNTNKIFNIESDDLKNKFIKKDISLTSSNELFYDRVLLSSTSRESYNKNNFDFDHIINKNLNNSVKKSFNIKRKLFNFKKEKFKNNSFYLFLDNFNKKLDDHFNNFKSRGNYVLLHDDETISKSFFSLEDSPFLYQKENNFYKKNSFNKSNKKNIKLIQDVVDTVTPNEIQEFQSFAQINSIKEYLSIYYSNNFLRNSSSFLARCINDLFDSLNKIEIDDNNKILFGFQKLLLSGLKDKDTFKMLIFYILEKYFKSSSDLENNNSLTLYNTLNQKSNGLYLKYLTNIFSFNNVKNQNTYTLRNIDNNIFTSTFEDLVENVIDEGQIYDDSANNTDSDGVNRGMGPSHGSYIISSGDIKTFLFPYTTTINKFRLGKLGIWPSYEGYAVKGCKKSIAELFVIHTYNYDSYLNKNEENEVLKSFFNSSNIQENDLNIKIQYIVLDQNKIDNVDRENLKFDDLQKDVNDANYLARSFVRSAGSNDSELSNDEVFERIPSNMFYKSLTTSNFTKDYTLDLLNDENNIVNKVSEMLKTMILYLFDDNQIKNTSSINLIENNTNQIDLMQDLVMILVDMFNDNFSIIEELSILKNITEINMTDGKKENFWDPLVRNRIVNVLQKIYEGCAEDQFNIEENYNLREGNNKYYSKKYLEYYKSFNLLRKSDYLEAIYLDLIYAYLNNFEINKTNLESNEEQNNIILNNITEDLAQIEAIENINISNIFNDDLRVCKISKRLYSELFYSNKNEINIKNNIARNKNKEFENLNIFQTDVLKLQNKKLLANLGLNLFLENDNIVEEEFNKIDILRFGITYDLANALKNEKILSINVYPVNTKYPELEFEPFEFLYTPVLTDITPASVNMLNGDINNFIGFYNLKENDFDKKYSVILKSTAFQEIKRILEIAKDRRTIQGYDSTLTPNFENIYKVYLTSQISNSIKYINECYHSIFDENKINSLNIDIDNILSNKTVVSIDSLSSKDFENIFSDKVDNIETYILNESSYASIKNKSEIIKNRIYGIDMFQKIDEKTSSLHFYKNYLSDSFFDIFSVRISKDAIRGKLKNRNKLTDNELNYILSTREDFSNSYTYTITVKAY